MEQKIDISLAECAKINFENFEKACPGVSQHPYYLIAKAQLDEALGYEGLGKLSEKIKKSQE